MGKLLTESDLYEYSGYEKGQRAKLVKFLESNRIPYHRGKGGSVQTTLDAVNSSLFRVHVENKVTLE